MGVIRRALLAVLVALAGCLGSPDQRGNAVIVASGADLQSMNSLITTHPLAKQVQRYALLTTLVRYDSALRISPYLARRWSWSAGGSQLTMTLHQGVRWHDGRPTTARDAAWTLSMALDSTVGYPRRGDLAALRAVRAVDDSTLTLRFARPMAEIPDVLTDLAVLPAHWLDSVSPAQLRRAAWNGRPIGNGPFRFVDHQPNRRWVFAANRDFPPSLGGPPRLDRLGIAVVDEPTTKLAALSSGELDFAGIQPAHAEFVRQDPALAVLDYPLFYSYLVVLNARRPPFDRLAVRRAISLAIDRVAIVSGYLFGFGSPADRPLDMKDPLRPPTQPSYAPGRGKALLSSAPLSFELLTVGSGEAAMEQMIQHQLARIGVTVTIRQLELATFLERVYGARDFEAAIIGISTDPEDGYLGPLLELAGVGPAGTDSRRVFADSLPAAFLYHARGLQGMNRRVRGVRMDLRGELASLAEWSVR